MPRWDFKCETCNESQMDVVLRVKHSDDELPKCTKCGTIMVKQPSTFSTIFKGSGFHAVDYRAPTRGY